MLSDRVKSCHLRAKIHLLEGKPLGIADGYSPHLKFPQVDYLASGRMYLEENVRYYSGQEFEAFILIPSWDDIRDRLAVGSVFSIQELDMVYGTGVVSELL